jgi:hypothetical protein
MIRYSVNVRLPFKNPLSLGSTLTFYLDSSLVVKPWASFGLLGETLVADESLKRKKGASPMFSEAKASHLTTYSITID